MIHDLIEWRRDVVSMAAWMGAQNESERNIKDVPIT